MGALNVSGVLGVGGGALDGGGGGRVGVGKKPNPVKLPPLSILQIAVVGKGTRGLRWGGRDRGNK